MTMSSECIITGRNSVSEALRAGRSITKLYLANGRPSQPLQRIYEIARERGVTVEMVPSKVLQRLAGGTAIKVSLPWRRPLILPI